MLCSCLEQSLPHALEHARDLWDRALEEHALWFLAFSTVVMLPDKRGKGCPFRQAEEAP